MPPYVFCEDCQCEVQDCEHLSHERKMAKIKEIETGWALDGIWDDADALGDVCARLWDRPHEERDYDTINRIQSRVLALRQDIEARHRRLPFKCDCDDCCYVRMDELLTDPVGSRIRAGIYNPDGTPHGPMCICDSCMEKLDRDDRTFWVVDGKAIVVHAHELDEFRREYPRAREVL